VVVPDDWLSGVDMVVDALVEDPDTKLLWCQHGGVRRWERSMA
jgi:hypothetical protein